MVGDCFNAITAFGKAFRYLQKYNRWSLLIVPGLMALGLIIVTIGALVVGLPLLIGIGSGVWAKVGDWVLRILIVVVSIYLFKYILLIFLAPFLSHVSDTVEKDLYPEKDIETRFSFGQALKDVVRGLRLSLRNLSVEMFWVILLSMSFLLGPLALISAPLLFIIQGYFMGFGNMDFTLERYFGVKGSIRFVRANKGIAIGNGIIFFLLFVSVVGIFLAPTLSTIAATIQTLERLGQSQNL